ncbi:MAG TPA: shikimate dehydrogenase [Chthoniobacterales bacterium]|nr:shikimate dehydrogenase [Chthoniobacterales bacterium]
MKKKRTTDRYTLADLENWRKAARDVKPPIRLGVFGDPVAHSLSPQMQNAALKHCKIDKQYVRFHIRAAELASALALISKMDFIGINLTLPHKIAAAGLVDELDENARRVGAVNAIKIDRPSSGSGVASSGKLRGFNTDGRGFSRAIREEFSVDLRDLRIMILGAGGAARAIALQCAKENCERLVVANRTPDKAQELADELRDFFAGPKVLGPVARLQAIPLEESSIRFQIAHVDLMVNATSIGLNRSDASPIPARLLAPHVMVYDTIYSAERTPLVSAAMEAGARAANGLSMLLYQGALAFEIWFQQEAPIEVMRKALGGSGSPNTI